MHRLTPMNSGEHGRNRRGASPKREAGGSISFRDASEQRRNPLFSRIFGVSYMKRYEKALSLYEIKLNIAMYIERLFSPHLGWIGALFRAQNRGQIQEIGYWASINGLIFLAV